MRRVALFCLVFLAALLSHIGCDPMSSLPDSSPRNDAGVPEQVVEWGDIRADEETVTDQRTINSEQVVLPPDGKVPEQGIHDRLPPVPDKIPEKQGISEVCKAVVGELSEQVIGTQGLKADYLKREEECGIRLAVFDDKNAGPFARYVGWSYVVSQEERLNFGASKLVVTDKYLLLAIFDKKPSEALTIELRATDELYCSTSTFKVKWPEVGQGFARLASLVATTQPADKADQAVCKYGPVFPIQIEAFPDMEQNTSPFIEFTSPGGGSRYWAHSTLITKAQSQKGFTLLIPLTRLQDGTKYWINFNGAYSRVKGQCTNVAVEIKFTYTRDAKPVQAKWSTGRDQNNQLCRTRSTTRTVKNDVLVLN